MPATNGFRLEKVAEANFPTRWGGFRIYGFAGHGPGRVEEAVGLIMGDLNERAGAVPPLVRIQSECLTADVFHSLPSDCRAQPEISLQRIARAQRGMPTYARHAGRRT